MKVRNPLVDPLNVLQAETLRRLRRLEEEEQEGGGRAEASDAAKGPAKAAAPPEANPRLMSLAEEEGEEERQVRSRTRAMPCSAMQWNVMERHATSAGALEDARCNATRCNVMERQLMSAGARGRAPHLHQRHQPGHEEFWLRPRTPPFLVPRPRAFERAAQRRTSSPSPRFALCSLRPPSARSPLPMSGPPWSPLEPRTGPTGQSRSPRTLVPGFPGSPHPPPHLPLLPGSMGIHFPVSPFRFVGCPPAPRRRLISRGPCFLCSW